MPETLIMRVKSTLSMPALQKDSHVDGVRDAESVGRRCQGRLPVSGERDITHVELSQEG